MIFSQRLTKSEQEFAGLIRNRQTVQFLERLKLFRLYSVLWPLSKQSPDAFAKISTYIFSLKRKVNGAFIVKPYSRFLYLGS